MLPAPNLANGQLKDWVTMAEGPLSVEHNAVDGGLVQAAGHCHEHIPTAIYSSFPPFHCWPYAYISSAINVALSLLCSFMYLVVLLAMKGKEHCFSYVNPPCTGS